MISRIELGRGGSVKIEWSFGGTAYLPVDAGGCVACKNNRETMQKRLKTQETAPM